MSKLLSNQMIINSLYLFPFLPLILLFLLLQCLG
uniref:Uncharacterized protein n=1 Tax=Siphoviridae sp. ctyjS2 TaxID=2827284 RepID=A0A8S5R4I7_9CAUD|nr:MAG TPA: hypothetical protein [Siphoviridae sp. ctyjS2]